MTGNIQAHAWALMDRSPELAFNQPFQADACVMWCLPSTESCIYLSQICPASAHSRYVAGPTNEAVGKTENANRTNFALAIDKDTRVYSIQKVNNEQSTTLSLHSIS
jgi:hypothetical protein